jgi:hypothetical protein
MNIPYYLLRSIGKMLDRIQAKSKDVDSSLFHSRLIKMLVSDELGKKDISWEHFVVTFHFNLDLAPTPQSQRESSLSPTSATKAGTSRKRKSRAHVQVLEGNKQVTEVEEEVFPSPHRDFSPPPPPRLEEVPSSTKVTSKRGKKLMFSFSPPTVEIKGKRPFTRSSIHKEDYREKSLPEIPIQKNKGKGAKGHLEKRYKTYEKGIENPVKIKQESLVYKGKGTKIPLERKNETSVKHFKEPVGRSEETTMKRKKGKVIPLRNLMRCTKHFPCRRKKSLRKSLLRLSMTLSLLIVRLTKYLSSNSEKKGNK